MLTKTAIKEIGFRLNVHPIHIRFFLSNMKSDSLNNIDVLYQQYTDENPKPFVKWVGGKRQLLRQFRDMDLYPPMPVSL